MPLFIQLKNKDRINLFKEVKSKINCSWEEFYPSLKISRPMFFNYLSGKYNLPKDLFLRLERISGIEIKDYKEIKQNKYMKKELVEPKVDSSLAEIFGVLNGDGHLSNFNHEVSVVGDSREKDYFKYLKELFEKNLNTNFTLFEEPNRIKLRTYSVVLSEILVNKYGFPKGNKLKKLKIPKQVLNSKKLSSSYIRGLFDTDGSFYLRRKNDPVIQITSASPDFLREIKEILISLGFNVSKGKQRVFIYRKNEINKFFEKVKPANSKHLKKYQNYLELSVDGLKAE